MAYYFLLFSIFASERIGVGSGSSLPMGSCFTALSNLVFSKALKVRQMDIRHHFHKDAAVTAALQSISDTASDNQTMDKNYIILNVNVIKSAWFTDTNCVHIFLYLLLSAAAHRKINTPAALEEGQIMTSFRKIQKETGISFQSVRSALRRLENFSLIKMKTQMQNIHYPTQKPTHQMSIVTICNYDYYKLKKALPNTETNTAESRKLCNPQKCKFSPYYKIKYNKEIINNGVLILSNNNLNNNLNNNFIVSTNVDTPPADAEGMHFLDFEKIWQDYGRRGTKKRAKSKFEKLSMKEKKEVAEYIKYYTAFTPPQYRKYLETLLNSEIWKDKCLIHDPNGKEIPYTDNSGKRLYRIADTDKFKVWFNSITENSNIPKVSEVTPDRQVNLNICYTLYPREMTKAVQVILHNSYFSEMAGKGMITFDYIFNPRNILKICERSVND